MNFPAKLIKLTEARGWRQADIVRALGESDDPSVRTGKDTVSRWFKGEGLPDIRTGLAVARVLGVPLEYLADDDLDDPPGELSGDEREMVDAYRELRVKGLSLRVALKRLEFGIVPSDRPISGNP